MKKYLFLLVIIALTVPSLLSAQGATCIEMEPFCTDTGASFPASTNTQAESDNQYGCLSTQPNPAWYYLEIAQPGYPSTGICPNGVPCDFFNGCVNGDGVDCSYDPQATEVADIPDAQTGEVYAFLITNFSGQPTEIFVNKTGGMATTDCSVLVCSPVNFLKNTPDGLAPLPDSINTTDDPIQLIAAPGNTPETDGYITPAFGIQITTDAAAPLENSLEIYNEPNGTGDLLAYWASTDMGGNYLGQIPDNSDFIAFSEYVDVV